MKFLKTLLYMTPLLMILCVAAFSSSGWCMAEETTRDQLSAESPQSDESDDALEATNAPGQIETPMKKCLSCCENKFLVCINMHPDRRICTAEKENCTATCKSEGASPSSWSDCWPQSAAE